MAEYQFSLATITADPTFARTIGLQPAIQGAAPADWQDVDFVRIPKWTVPTLDNDNTIATGTDWVRELNTNSITTRTAARGLQLAMSLRSMNPGDGENYLLRQEVRANVNAGYRPVADIEFPGIGTFSDMPITATIQVGASQLAAPILPIGAPSVGVQVHQNQMVDPLARIRLLEVVPQGEQDADRRIREEALQVLLQERTRQLGSAAGQARAYAFLAFYCMRLLSKSADNLVKSLDVMKNRFIGFYGPHVIVTEFAPTLQAITNYQAALRSNPMLSNTYIHSLAYTQAGFTPPYLSNEYGVLNYGGFLPLSYTGLHAYNLFVQLHEVSRYPINLLLTIHNTSVMRPAILKINRILTDFERTATNPNALPYFRYCAHFGAHYFTEIRTKQCAHLTYALACELNCLKAATEASDPEQIVGVQSLSVDMKRTLKLAAEMLGRAFSERMLAGVNQSSGVWAHAAMAARIAPQVVNREEEEFDYEGIA